MLPSLWGCGEDSKTRCVQGAYHGGLAIEVLPKFQSPLLGGEGGEDMLQVSEGLLRGELQGPGKGEAVSTYFPTPTP